MGCYRTPRLWVGPYHWANAAIAQQGHVVRIPAAHDGTGVQCQQSTVGPGIHSLHMGGVLGTGGSLGLCALPHMGTCIRPTEASSSSSS